MLIKNSARHGSRSEKETSNSLKIYVAMHTTDELWIPCRITLRHFFIGFDMKTVIKKAKGFRGELQFKNCLRHCNVFQR